MRRFSIFQWFFTKEEKELYTNPLELLEDRVELLERDHLDLINKIFELEKKINSLEQCTKN